MNGFWLVSYVALWAVVLALVMITLALVRIVRDSNSRWNSSPSLGLRVGERAPEAVLVDSATEKRTSFSSYLGSKPVLVLFADAVCPSCHAAAPRIEEFYQRHKADLETVILCRGDARAARTFADAAPVKHLPVYYDPEGDVALAFDVTLTPLAMFFDVQGILRDKLTISQIMDLDSRMASALGRVRRSA